MEVTALTAHESNEIAHAPFVSFSSVSQWLEEHRQLKHHLVSLSSSQAPQTMSSPATISSAQSSQSAPLTGDSSPTTHTIPYVSDRRTWISIVSTTVYADQSDTDTFPAHLVEEKSESFIQTYRPLKYPSLVVENGRHNSIVAVRVRTNGWKHLQLGWMNHHGTYLRRLIPGTRVQVSSPTDSEENSLFEEIKVTLLSHDEDDDVHEAEILFKVRDMTDDNRFEGHYRDLRVVAFCMDLNDRVIRAYDVGIVIRTSPNASYLSEKRVSATAVELGWNQALVVPPMMGVRPTMRIDLPTTGTSPMKRMKLFNDS